ncbi:hypothetical protein H8F21_15615 [Pseudomonas sp. P66]|uniref:Uncharacterized protein n=1 Tax=Pseudomonas arcuscaelestis TaxID=2710591 RepID=A0ABS2BZT8_9PSED|nr:hypothetical protein [Pseudomonas arcuscaelestis]MBM5458995.1 hypothetical protein [Pseudomonas arcuscaelestis]
MKRESNVAVSKIAAYAEDPGKFVSSAGGAYNPKLARMGTAAHSRIGSGPNKAAFVVAVLVIVSTLLYFKIIEI